MIGTTTIPRENLEFIAKGREEGEAGGVIMGYLSGLMSAVCNRPYIFLYI